MEKKISLHGLRQCLRGYDQGLRNEHCAYRFGNWKIGDGAYSENWRLSYKGEEVLRSLASSNEECIDNLALSIEDFQKVYLTIANEYGKHEKLDLDMVLNHPELEQKLDLSKVLVEEDQHIWEKHNKISVDDFNVIREIAAELDRRYDIVLEKDSIDPKNYNLGVYLGTDVGTVWYELPVNGSLKELEKSLQRKSSTFDAVAFRDELEQNHKPKNEEQSLNLSMTVTSLQYKLKYAYEKARKIIREHSKTVAR